MAAALVLPLPDVGKNGINAEACLDSVAVILTRSAQEVHITSTDREHDEDAAEAPYLSSLFEDSDADDLDEASCDSGAMIANMKMRKPFWVEQIKSPTMKARMRDQLQLSSPSTTSSPAAARRPFDSSDTSTTLGSSLDVCSPITTKSPLLFEEEQEDEAVSGNAIGAVTSRSTMHESMRIATLSFPAFFGLQLQLDLGHRDSIATAIWRASMVMAGLLAAAGSQQERRGKGENSTFVDLQNQEVMEIGCGSGLVGLVAGLFGAKEVCFTDCDDRALVRLKEYLAEVQRVRHGEEKEKDASSASGYNLITSAGFGADEKGSSGVKMSSAPSDHLRAAQRICWRFSVCHHLWEEDEAALKTVGGEIRHSPQVVSSTSCSSTSVDGEAAGTKYNRSSKAAQTMQARRATPTRSVRHWSNAYRTTADEIPALPADKQCDVMLISDCLYFSSQEDPLVAVLRRRLRRPHGQALILIQERSSGGVQMERFVEKLLAAEPVDDPRVDRAEPEDSSPAGTSERLCFSVTELREEEVGDWKDHLKYVCQTTSSGLVEELQTDTDHQADNFIAMTGFERKSHILRVGFATTKNVK
eukprot:CAMPEP_0178987960 /NCGR_PEP_ID=MMETSP0795-20121207/3556_1 /TAXON_ID=88552 /ORGANISM="Amoebophrya sp., Strain Ameob2" /LENGTH=585 /DNA_ID=CAMNT_0020679203 /DNA_START=457 /DNA_END=2214 /DNA_ORIENTATION=+